MKGIDKMFNAHSYALQIETTVRSIVNCDRGGVGGTADADFIEKKPFIPIMFVLGNFYNKIDYSTKQTIDDFIEDYAYSMDKAIEEMGEEKIKEIVKRFHHITSTI